MFTTFKLWHFLSNFYAFCTSENRNEFSAANKHILTILPVSFSHLAKYHNPFKPRYFSVLYTCFNTGDKIQIICIFIMGPSLQLNYGLHCERLVRQNLNYSVIFL